VEAQADAAEEKVNGHALVFFPIVSFDDITIENVKPAKRARAHATAGEDTWSNLGWSLPEPSLDAAAINTPHGQPGSSTDAPTMALVPIGPSGPGLQSNLANMPEYVIEGVVARPECRGEVGQAGAYRRYRVNCPWHREGKGQCCSRSRNIDKGMDPHLRPLSELGVWLAKGIEFPDKASHQKWMPTPEQVAAYRLTL